MIENLPGTILKVNKLRKGRDGEAFTPLTQAVMTGNIPILKALLRLGATPNLPAAGVPPLSLAVQENYLACARLLLENGANINQVCDTGTFKGQTALYAAISSPQAEPETVQFLLNAKAKQKKGLEKGLLSERTPLEVLIFKLSHLSDTQTQPYIQKMALLLEAGANANAKNYQGFPPLAQLA